ncbi:MAG: hypothetical protein JXQ29_14835, partial [Planctomycetes bacterium]|nr:hypothetical protein [Planctomycetota bacterium]
MNRRRAIGPTGLAARVVLLVFGVFGSGLGLAQVVPGALDPLADVPGLVAGVESVTAAEFREWLAWWAHDDRGGREPGTPGSVEAGEAAASEFARLGLEPYGDVVDGRRTYLQNFERGGKQGYRVAETVLRTGDRSWVLNQNYTLVGRNDASDLKNLPLVFAGYGIQSRRQEYDDYKSADVKGKAILIFNHEPREKDPQSRWNGDKPTPEASIYRKARIAAREGVRLILMVDGPLDRDPARDPLTGQESGTLSPGLLEPGMAFGVFATRDCPLLHVRRELADALLAGSGRTLEDVQRSIDEPDAPASFPLAATVSFRAVRELIRPARNIIARFPGSDPRLRDEAIVIGAHYDHIGPGDYGSRSPARRGE